MSEFNLPEGWVLAKIGDLNSFKSSIINPDRFGSETFELFSVPIFPTKKPEIVSGAEIGSSKQLVDSKDILLCKINPRINRVWCVSNKGLLRQIASSEWIVFRQQLLNENFVLRYFQSTSFRELLCSDVTGVGGSLTRAQPKNVVNYLLPLAPLAEQQQIAQTLDKLLAQVDTLKTRLDAIPNILKRFRQSVLAAAVSGRLTEEWRKEHKMPLWRNSNLGKEFNCIDGDRGPNYPKKEEYLSEGHCLFLSTKNVRNYGFDFSDVVFIGKERHEKLRNGTLNRGDLVLTTRGTLGYVASYDDNTPFDVVRINSGMLILRKKDPSHLNEFFKMLIASPLFQRIIDEQRTGSAQPQLPAKILKEFELQIPSNKEQTEIVRCVEQLFAYADHIEQRVKDAQARVNHLTQSILAKAFRGELTAEWRAQNPALISGENSAAALLARIKAEREATAKPRRSLKR